MKLETVSVGDHVNVERLPGDIFDNDFTGYVVEKNNCYVVVEDQDGDCFSVEADQLTFCSDDYM